MSVRISIPRRDGQNVVASHRSRSGRQRWTQPQLSWVTVIVDTSGYRWLRPPSASIDSPPLVAYVYTPTAGISDPGRGAADVVGACVVPGAFVAATAVVAAAIDDSSRRKSLTASLTSTGVVDSRSRRYATIAPVAITTSRTVAASHHLRCRCFDGFASSIVSSRSPVMRTRFCSL